MNDEIITTASQPGSNPDNEKLKSAKTITTVVYALQAVAFLVGITALVAIIINYVKRGDVQGTWLASHFKWQIRTFWYSMLWAVIGFVLLFVFIGYLVLMANVVWVIYRIVKGWLRLVDNKPMYV
ncbi:DUF4870 family protein [Eoetvoesiella caeni]|uniref:Putative membrane protein n=1 Tax=Eoetvoesiella caeni TaxID=645616 RepID=A0A366HL14_9BURK|nr:hypothetical protein [Eoetvoesiella caeni]MCI2807457.1 hypothetical protein [Eoetvoesiella caeni]NYT53148.1 hypothetical protein [Eoetvoesiella caeni]RBP43126.1 putative membrane protein [Eoetvoesiella caeni]